MSQGLEGRAGCPRNPCTLHAPDLNHMLGARVPAGCVLTATLPTPALRGLELVQELGSSGGSQSGHGCAMQMIVATSSSSRQFKRKKPKLPFFPHTMLPDSSVLTFVEERAPQSQLSEALA